MKVVLFCGGLGMRLREFSEEIPKPMVRIGYRPILWHVMNYYAHFGHKDFILCLGYKADVIKNYFLKYDECLSNDFVLSDGGAKIDLLGSDIHDWRITFVDTGITTNIGGRLMAVKHLLEDEEAFLANYSDNVTDFDLSRLTDQFAKQNKIASFLLVRPAQSFHLVSQDSDQLVSKIRPVAQSDVWINGGYFIFKRGIFEYMRDGEELVEEPFQRLIDEEQLTAYRYEGFWACMDTFKEKQNLDAMYARGEAPWELWKTKQER